MGRLNWYPTGCELLGRHVSCPCIVVVDSRRVSFCGGGLASSEGVNGSDNGSDGSGVVIWRKCD